MRKVLLAPCILLLVVAQHLAAADAAQTVDLRRGVPEDVFLAVHGKHNSERDFHRKYYDEVWKTVQETQIMDRLVKIVDVADGRRAARASQVRDGRTARRLRNRSTSRGCSMRRRSFTRS